MRRRMLELDGGCSLKSIRPWGCYFHMGEFGVKSVLLCCGSLLVLLLFVNLAFGGIAGFQEYIIPGQESLLRAHYASIDNDPAVQAPMHAVISITASTDGTIVNYDHWENGYGAPDEVVTLNSGQNRIFESANIPTNPRGTSTFYDGGDRISVIGGPAAVSRASWPESPGVVMATGFELLPVQAMRTTFEMPAGSDLNQDNRDLPFADFQHVVLMVQSVVDNNTITIYAPDHTTVLWTGTLNKGESVTDSQLQNVLKGTRVEATGRIQIQFLTGRAVTNTGSQINGFSGIPTTLWSKKYHSPTPSFRPNDYRSRTDIYLYNPNLSAITVTYQDSSSGSFTIDPEELVSFRAKTGHFVPVFSGVSFSGTDTFWGFSQVGTGYDTYDWGGILIPDEFARDNYVIGWAPGALDLSNNYSAVYIMAVNDNTTVNVDFNQDQVIDESFTLSFPALRRVVDASDKDMTGAQIWGTDALVMTFGEISGAPTAQASPALDLGYTIIPLADEFTDAVLAITKSAGDAKAALDQPTTFSLQLTAYNYPVTGVDAVDHLPPGWQYIASSAQVSYSNGSPSQSIEPALSGNLSSGWILTWDLSETIDPGQSVTIIFSATPTGSASLGINENCAEAAGMYAGNTFNPNDCLLIDVQNVAKVGDRVWNDQNRNGIQDPSESGLVDVSVELHASDGALVATTLTDASGAYTFADVAPGDYYLLFVAPAGYGFAPSNQGGDDALDSDVDPLTGRTGTVTLAAGLTDESQDAGLCQLVPRIGIKKYTNGDDADLPTGPSVPVGAAITWRYEITNPGDVALTNIVVSDNVPGVTPGYQSGDADSDGQLDPGEIWIFEATGTATAGQYVNQGTATGYYNGTPVSAGDASHYFGGQAGVQIIKSVNGDDANYAPGPNIAPGDPVTWTYVLTNSGNITVSGVLVTDSEPGISPAYLSGDNGNGLLEPGESWTFSATGTARIGPYLNVGTVNGVDSYNQSVSDSDPAYYFGPDPAIKIEKLVNGDDADFPMGPAIPVGGALEWRFVVTNPGNVPLSGIVVSDDHSIVPVAVDLSPADGFIDGDLNLDQQLDPGETWIYTAAGVSTAGQYTNLGSVIGRYDNQIYSDSDPCNYFGGVSGIEIVKTTNDADADDPPGPGIIAGAPVTWIYTVRNTGNGPIRDIAVSDDQGVVATPVDDAPVDGSIDGDSNTNGLLDVTETWIFRASGTAQIGQYANVGTVTGVDSYLGQAVSNSDASHYFGASPGIQLIKLTNGEDANLPPGPTIGWGSTVTWQYLVMNTGNVPLQQVTVTDSDPAVVPIYTTGDLNDDGLLDMTENWIYEAIGTAAAGQYVNSGTASATYNGVVFSDTDASHYFSELPRGTIGDLVWNDLNRNGLQDTGEPGLENVTVELHKSSSELVTTSLSSSSGQYLFPQVVPGDYYLLFIAPTGYAFAARDQGGDDTADSDANPADGRSITFTLDPGEADLTRDAGLYQLVPRVLIKKYTNGDDADLPTGPSIPVGSPVDWSYVVTNPGDVALANITVSDNQPGVSPQFVGGDDGDNLLEPAETWTWQASGQAALGQYVNLGTVIGYYNNTPVSDDDPSHYFGGQAGIQIKKYVNGQDANEPPGPNVTPGNPVNWLYLVTNTGNVAVSQVLVTDSEAGITPVYSDGDNGNNTLDPAETWRYAASSVARTGQYLNIGTVNAIDIFMQPLSDSDPAHYFGPAPAIHIQMMVNGDDANLPTGPAIPVGQPLLYSYLITNSGNVPLSAITVTDDQGAAPLPVDTTPADGYNDGDTDRDNQLDVGETWIYSLSGTAAAGQHLITGTVTSQYNSLVLTDDDPCCYFGGYSGISITKRTNLADADNPPGPGILVGNPVLWTYQVQNTGNTPIRDLTVTDDQGVTVTPLDLLPADGLNDGDLNKNNVLDPDETWLFSGSGTALPGQYANIGTATGTDSFFGQPVSDQNASHYFGAQPLIHIIKLTNGVDANEPPGPNVISGGTITWQYLVVNAGNVPLDNITVSDSDPSVVPVYNTGDLNNNRILESNETWIFGATGTAVPGQYSNIGTARGGYNGIQVQNADPSYYYCESVYDFGDAMDPQYPTLAVNNGARHAIGALFLGSAVDGEADGLPSPGGLGDDNDGLDDEDGVSFPSLPLIQNSVNMVSVVSSGIGYLNAWIDFNNDGDWLDSGEHIITDYIVSAGVNTISFTVPMIIPNAAPATLSLNSRFRLSSQRALGVTGAAPDGEVEDYVVSTYVPVELTSFTATVKNGAVELSWTTQSESENLGFILFRAESEASEYERITRQIIPGAGNSSQKNDYQYVDHVGSGDRDYYYKLADVSLDGVMTYHQVLKVTVAAPSDYALEQNYPNPFNPTTTINFSLKETGVVSLAIYNLRGQRVRQLAMGKLDQGFHSVVWDAHDDLGQVVPSGSYVCVLRANGINISRQMTLLK